MNNGPGQTDKMGYDGFVWFFGQVEDRNDPLKLGRVRVRDFLIHTNDVSLIPTDSLPWAIPITDFTNGAVAGVGQSPTGIQTGAHVFGFYRDGKAAQEPVILGTYVGNPGYRRDPNTNDVLDTRHDVPALARHKDQNDNVLENVSTFINAKDNGRSVDVPTANPSVLDQQEQGADGNYTGTGTGGWSEPKSNYNAQYPANKVLYSEQGHVIEVDDTPESERIMFYHNTGTFWEIHPTGDRVTRVIGDDYEIVVKDKNVNVKGDVNLTIDGNCTTYVKGNWDVQVNGNKTELIYGKHTTTVMGDSSYHTYSNRTEKAQGNRNQQVFGSSTETVHGAVTESYRAGQTTGIKGTLDIDATTEVDMRGGVIHLNKAGVGSVASPVAPLEPLNAPTPATDAAVEAVRVRYDLSSLYIDSTRAQDILAGVQEYTAIGQNPSTVEGLEYGDGGAGGTSPSTQAASPQQTRANSSSPFPASTYDANLLEFLDHVDNRVSPTLLSILQEGARRLDKRFKITSGYRDPEYNASVGGARRSMHTRGLATDILMQGSGISNREEFVRVMAELGIQGFGFYNSFIHVDIGGKRYWGSNGSRSSTPSWAVSQLRSLGWA